MMTYYACHIAINYLCHLQTTPRATAGSTPSSAKASARLRSSMSARLSATRNEQDKENGEPLTQDKKEDLKEPAMSGGPVFVQVEVLKPKDVFVSLVVMDVFVSLVVMDVNRHFVLFWSSF